jgi:hypothetical protein
MYSNEKLLGTMLAYPAYDREVLSLFIGRLISLFPRQQKIGTNFINFAKRLSAKLGCEGRIHLHAESIGGKTEQPHVFYRKLNFTSEDRKLLKKLDWKMLIGKKLPLSFKAMDMYLPAEKQAPENIYRRLYLWLEKHKKLT